MKKLGELQDYFYEFIYPNLEDLEKQRQEAFSFLKTAAIFLFFIDILVLFFISQNFPLNLNIVIGVIGVGIAVFLTLYSWKTKSFQNHFKDTVIEKLVSFIAPNLLYLKNSHITKFEYESSFLFPNEVDKFNGSDLIEGKIDGVSLKFSNLHTLEEKRDSKGKTSYQTLFKGLFFIADFNKNFHSRTLVLPDNAEKFFGNFAHIFQALSSYGELIKLDNPTFEKEFVVYGFDQIEARYILSHSLMESILELKKLLKNEISISFNGSKIYIAVSKPTNSFEAKIYKKVTTFSEVQTYFQTISLMVDIVKVLSLDVRIWSKA